MNSLASIASVDRAFQTAKLQSTPELPDSSAQVRETFQDFVAGTFYKQMLKALRSTQNEVAYFNGGPAERIFQGQLDQQVAEDLAKSHGNALSEPLFNAFMQQHRAQNANQPSASPPTSPLAPGQFDALERK